MSETDSPALAAVIDPQDPKTWPEPEPGRCWFLDCPNQVPHAGGRPAKVCNLTVGRLRHNRMNKSLLSRGRLQLPAPGAAAAAVDEDAGDMATPVTAARRTVRRVLDEILEHVEALPSLTQRWEAAAAVVSDQDQVATEIANLNRTGQEQVDQLRTDLGNATRQITALRSTNQDLADAAARAEETAELALTGEEQAVAERDQALAQRDEAIAARDQHAQRATDAETALATKEEELETAGQLSDQLARDLEAAGQEIGQLNKTIGEAHQAGIQLAADRQRVVDELDRERERAETLRTDLEQVRTREATLTAQLDAANQQIQTERTHAAERLADQKERTDAAEHTIEALRKEFGDQLTGLHASHAAELDELRRQLAEANAKAKAATARKRTATRTASRTRAAAEKK